MDRRVTSIRGTKNKNKKLRGLSKGLPVDITGDEITKRTQRTRRDRTGQVYLILLPKTTLVEGANKFCTGGSGWAENIKKIVKTILDRVRP